jgi:lipoprotein-anchoring transpeptidase ErfK/SrfK
MAKAATGAKFSNGNFATPSGHHITAHKRPSRHMAAGNLAYNGYDLPGVPWISYITENGISLHGTYWHNNFGFPRSHGCINLAPKAAQWIYLWTLPVVPPNAQYVHKSFGTSVDII